jgi:hypothetical protein
MLDAYEWKARWIPTTIVLLPSFITIYYCFPDLHTNVVLTAGSGMVSVGLIYVAAMALRDLGLRRQPQLWESWGGPPSTRFARMTDARFDTTHKQRIHLAVRRRFGIELLPADNEANNLLAADKVIAEAFRRVREYVRQNDSVGLVGKHNAEYGFARHLYAGREVALALALAGVFGSGFARSNSWMFNLGSQLNALFALLWLPFAWFFLPGMLKRAAETYAERAWMTFLELEESQ